MYILIKNLCLMYKNLFPGEFIKKDKYFIISKITQKSTQEWENAYLAMINLSTSTALIFHGLSHIVYSFSGQ